MEVLRTRLRCLDPFVWSPNRLIVVVVLWCALGAASVAVWGEAWLLPLWLPVLGLIFWRADGHGILITLSWTVPLGVLLFMSLALAGTVGRIAALILTAVGTGILVLPRVQRTWIRLVTGGSRTSSAAIPEHALRLRSALGRVDTALVESLRDHDAARIHRAVEAARDEIGALQIPESDPWSEPRRMAISWLRDLEAISRRPDRDVNAYAAANRRARDLKRAEDRALRSGR